MSFVFQLFDFVDNFVVVTLSVSLQPMPYWSMAESRWKPLVRVPLSRYSGIWWRLPHTTQHPTFH